MGRLIRLLLANGFSVPLVTELSVPIPEPWKVLVNIAFDDPLENGVLNERFTVVSTEVFNDGVVEPTTLNVGTPFTGRPKVTPNEPLLNIVFTDELNERLEINPLNERLERNDRLADARNPPLDGATTADWAMTGKRPINTIVIVRNVIFTRTP
jgi:hypothetical protein